MGERRTNERDVEKGGENAEIAHILRQKRGKHHKVCRYATPFVTKLAFLFVPKDLIF